MKKALAFGVVAGLSATVARNWETVKTATAKRVAPLVLAGQQVVTAKVAEFQQRRSGAER